MTKAPRPKRSASEFLPDRRDLESLQKAAQRCEGCDLYLLATQTVFGDGQADADVMLVGEQPGDKEDLTGKPFVGPAGQLLDACLEAAGIDRSKVYVTNAVKHFKWEPRGKIRLHKKPTLSEIAACSPWLDAEIEAVHPQVIVCLGATAAQGLLGSDFRLTKHRGEVMEVPGYPPIVATIHPSYILRSQDYDFREEQKTNFIEDLSRVVEFLRRK